MNELITIEQLNKLSTEELTQALVESADFGEKYAALKEMIDTLAAIKKAIDAKVGELIVPLYNADGTSTISNAKYNFTYVAPTTSLTVDSAKLKKEFPDVYKQCVKTQNRSASLRVTEKKIEDGANA